MQTQEYAADEANGSPEMLDIHAHNNLKVDISVPRNNIEGQKQEAQASDEYHQI